MTAVANRLKPWAVALPAKEQLLYQARVSRIALWSMLPLLLPSAALRAADTGEADKAADAKPPSAAVEHFTPEQQSSKGSVTIEGRRIDYDAYAGTVVVHPKDWDDVPQNAPKDQDKNPRPEASMFYVAYFKTADKAATGKSAAPRPVTFLFNGGPGSSTV